MDELEQRLRALAEGAQQGAAFDARSWAWLIGLGVLLPAVLILLGWWYA